MSVGIGMVVPFDFAVDREYWRYTPEDIQLHMTRTAPARGPISLALAEAVGDEQAVRAATSSLVPVTRTVVYACTSGSFVRGMEGEARLRLCMREAGATTALTTSGALLEALASLGVRRIAVATPYDGALTDKLTKYLGEAGFVVTSMVHLSLTKDVHLTTDRQIVELALTADHINADAVFMSCTGFATFDLIERIERLLEKPFLTANQVTMWAALRAVGKAPPDLSHQLFRRTHWLR